MSLSRSRGGDGMTRKFLTRHKVADGERHDRFVAMTQQIGALDDEKNFEKAFKSAFENVASSRRPAGHRTNVRARGTAMKVTERPIDTGTAAAKGGMLSIDQAQVEKANGLGATESRRS
jgi:hypothetical protein